MAQRTIMLYYLRTGGGHLAPASSLARYLTAHHGDAVRPVLADGLEGSGKFARGILEDGYRLLQAGGKWIYEFLYALNTIPLFAHINNALVTMAVGKAIERNIRREDPAVIVNFHFFLIEPIHAAVKHLGRAIPIITVVTDPFTPHPIWFLRKRQRLIVSSDRAKAYGIRRGVPADSLTILPFIIDPRFAVHDDTSASARVKLGIAPDRRVVLIIGGGDGIPKGKRILEELLRKGPDVDIMIVCGRNVLLQKEAEKLRDAFHNRLHVFGYATNVDEIISAADVVITKCGASTFNEILMKGKIPVVIDYLWGQEKGNMEYLRDNELGVYEPRIDRLPGLIQELSPGSRRGEHLRYTIAAANIRSGLPDVARHIMKVLEE